MGNIYYNQIETNLGLCYYYSAIHSIINHPTLLIFLFFPYLTYNKGQKYFEVNMMIEKSKIFDISDKYFEI